jgi:cytochrome c oxidase subunit 1
VTASAYVLGLSLLLFLVNVVWSLVFKRVPGERNPWQSKSIEWQLPTPVPVHDFDEMPVYGADPYPYGDGPLPVPAIAPATGGA